MSQSDRDKEITATLKVYSVWSAGLQVLFGLFVLSLLLLGAVYIFSNRSAIWKYFDEADYKALAIATDPEGATVIFDGKVIGISPLRYRTSPESHVIVARKEGYEQASQAIDLEYDKYDGPRFQERRLVKIAAPWVVNLKLKPISAPAVTTLPLGTTAVLQAQLTSEQQKRIAQIENNIRNVRSLIGADPDEAVSFAVLKGKVESLDNQVAALRKDVETANTLKLGIIGLFVTSLLAIIAAFRRPPR